MFYPYSMPLYDFQCKDCGRNFELSLTLAEREEKESAKKVCPSCSSGNVQQRMTFSGGISAGTLKTLPGDGPPCASGGVCPSGKCPWEG